MKESRDQTSHIAVSLIAALSLAHLADLGTTLCWVLVSGDVHLAAERNPMLRGHHYGYLIAHCLLCYLVLVLMAGWAGRRCADWSPSRPGQSLRAWLSTQLYGRELTLAQQRRARIDSAAAAAALVCAGIAACVALRFAAAISNALLLCGIHHGADTWPGVVAAAIAGAWLGLLPIQRLSLASARPA